VAVSDNAPRRALLRLGFALEYVTLGWNVAGIAVLAIAALSARSVALAGFGLDSLIEIGASMVVIWELPGTGAQRQRRALALIGCGFTVLAVYLLAQSTIVLAAGDHPRPSVPGIIWTAVTAAVMFALAAGKARTGRALDNPVLRTEGRVTMIDGILAVAVLAGLALNAGPRLVVGRPGRRVCAGLVCRPRGTGDLHGQPRLAGGRAADPGEAARVGKLA
jgi:divalent metal cation (Fe/Co/Zn/Cd) transporter